MGAQTNCIAAHTKPNIPVIRAASAIAPPSNAMMSLGSTGAMMPSASMSSATVTKMNANAARPCVRVVSFADGADVGGMYAASWPAAGVVSRVVSFMGMRMRDGPSTTAAWRPCTTSRRATRRRRATILFHRGLPRKILALELLEHLVGEHLVSDRGDLFGLLPRLVQRVELAGERAALSILVGGHLERKAVGDGQAEERGAQLAPRPAARPERAVGELHREPLGEREARREDGLGVGGVGKQSPRCAQRERGHTRKVAVGVARIIQLGDRVAHVGSGGRTDVERGQELRDGAKTRALGEGGEPFV